MILSLASSAALLYAFSAASKSALALAYGSPSCSPLAVTVAISCPCPILDPSAIAAPASLTIPAAVAATVCSSPWPAINTPLTLIAVIISPSAAVSVMTPAALACFSLRIISAPWLSLCFSSPWLSASWLWHAVVSVSAAPRIIDSLMCLMFLGCCFYVLSVFISTVSPLGLQYTGARIIS